MWSIAATRMKAARFFLMERIPVTAMRVAAARHSMRAILHSTCPTLTNHQNTPFWNGLSFAFQYDYMVRLYVEYLDNDTTKLFETAQDYSPSKRMAWGDVDGDGDQDLLLQGPRLMVNTGGLLQASTNTGLPAADQDYAGVWGDLDNDGCLDLFLFSESTTGKIGFTRMTVMAALPRSPSSPPLPTIRSVRPVMAVPLRQRRPRLGPIWMPMDF